MGQTQVDEVFEQCLAAMQTQGLTVEDCLQLHPAFRAELEPLLSLAARLQTARSLRPAAEFRAAAAQRLSKRAAARPAPSRQKIGFRGCWTSRRAQPRMRLAPLLIGALFVILIASSFGAVAASAQSLPGDFLYPVKRADEALHLALTLDEAGRAVLRLDYASQRINEAVSLIQENRPQALNQVLADYNDQIQSEVTLLQPGSPLTVAQQLALAGRLLDETQRQADGLDFVSRAAPPAAQARIEAALSSSQQAHNQAARILQESGSSQNIRPTPSAQKPTQPAALAPIPTLSPTPPSGPTQGPSPSAPVQAASPASLPPQATPSNSTVQPTNDVVRTPAPTPNTGGLATHVATLISGPTSTPPATYLPSPTRIKATPQPAVGLTPPVRPTQTPSLNTPVQPALPASPSPQATQPDSASLPTNVVVPTPDTGNAATPPPKPTSALPPVNALPVPTKSK